MPPKYLHLRDFRNLATGVVFTHGAFHHPPSVNLNVEQVRKVVQAMASHLDDITLPAIVGGDANMKVAHRLNAPVRNLKGWDNTHETFAEVDTFRGGGGGLSAIDWAMWRTVPEFRPRGQVVIDFPGVERGKGGEHYVLVLEADVRRDVEAR